MYYLYVNGQQASSKSETDDSKFASTKARTNCYIGNSSWSISTFDGQIKSLNIWEYALSADEISELYNLGRNKSVLKHWRKNYDYEIDGAIITHNAIYPRPP